MASSDTKIKWLEKRLRLVQQIPSDILSSWIRLEESSQARKIQRLWRRYRYHKELQIRMQQEKVFATTAVPLSSNHNNELLENILSGNQPATETTDAHKPCPPDRKIQKMVSIRLRKKIDEIREKQLDYQDLETSEDDTREATSNLAATVKSIQAADRTHKRELVESTRRLCNRLDLLTDLANKLDSHLDKTLVIADSNQVNESSAPPAELQVFSLHTMKNYPEIHRETLESHDKWLLKNNLSWYRKLEQGISNLDEIFSQKP